jgi:SH3-like domain-containing protein
MLRFSPNWVRIILAGLLCVEGASALALEFKTTREQTIVYDNPTHRSKKLSILSSDYPVEILDRDEEGWLKVRDMSGEIGWVEDQSVGTRKRVLVRNNYAEILRQPESNARLAFRAEKGVVLERLSSPDEEGWVRVRIPNTRQEGFIKSTHLWGIDRRKSIDILDRDRTRKSELARNNDLDRSDDDIDIIDRSDAYGGRTRQVSTQLERDDALSVRRRTKLRRSDRALEERRLAAEERLRKDEDEDLDSIHAAPTRHNRSHSFVRQKGRNKLLTHRRSDEGVASEYTVRRVAKPKSHYKVVAQADDVEDVRPAVKHYKRGARRPRIQDPEQLVNYSSDTADTDRVALRERLKERRLKAEREARDQRTEYQRPMRYSSVRSDVRKHQDNWDRNDYTDEDRDERFNPPQVHH